MKIGLQSGDKGDVAPLDVLTSLGVDVARIDVTEAPDYAAVVARFESSSVVPLFLIRDIAKAQPLMDAALPKPIQFALEVFNEPNINGISVDTYVAGVNQVFSDARSRGFAGPFYAGAIANLNPAGFDYLRLAEPRLSPGIDIAFHRYQPGTQTDLSGKSRRLAPWSPFSSREAELQELRQVCRGRRLAVTEFGYHTATENIFLFKVRLTDEQVRDNLVADLHLYESSGIELACIYQWTDGPNVPGTNAPKDYFMDRFGLVRADGTLKPQADAITLYRNSQNGV